MGGAAGHLGRDDGVVRDSVEKALDLLDKGQVRVAEKFQDQFVERYMPKAAD